MGTQPPLETLSATDNEALIGRLDRRELIDSDYQSLIQVLRLVVKLQGELASRQVSISRLQHLLFGSRSERRQLELVPTGEPETDSPLVEMDKTTEPSDSPTTEPTFPANVVPLVRKPRKGHGRLGAAAYTGAQVIPCPHEAFKPGDGCPDPLCRGHLICTIKSVYYFS